MITAQSIKAIMAQAAGVGPQALADDTPLSDLLVDSFAVVEVSIALQEELDITFEAADLTGIRTVGELVALTQDKAWALAP